MNRLRLLGAATLAASLALPGLAAAQQAPQGTLDVVRARGTLVCGVNAGIAGFSAPDSQGRWTGLDVDYCRAIAAALFGDATKVRYVPTTSQNRVTALQSGEIDVLARNTTWTLSRDTSLGLDFTGVNFYDGQGFMVRKDLGVKSAKELNGATICVSTGTTTEQNLTDWFRANQLQFKPVVIERIEEVNAAYLSGRCDALTADVSSLASTRASQGARAEEHVILPEVISKEPLAAAVRQGDARWTDLVRWTFFAMLEAEELGLTSANVDSRLGDPNPEVQRLLGKTGELGKMLGVPDNWAYSIIKQVGNYGESFARNLGPLGIARGLNALWTKGGLQYSPPFR